MTTRTADAWIEHWRAGMRWRRRVELELQRLGLSFAQWLVLDCIATLRCETNDAVSQLQVVQRLELDKATISQLMKRPDERALIDRAPAYPTRENRIYLQGKGERLARQGRVIVEVVSSAVELER